MKRLVHHELTGHVEEGLLEVVEGFDVRLLRRLDGHCRSHNIAAECCVSSRCGSVADLGSSASKAGGAMVVGRSVGSCLMVG